MENNPVLGFHNLPLAVLLFLLALLVSATEHASVPSITTDAQSLLMFKKMTEKEINGTLSGWQADRDPCSWHGVSCSLGRVTQLNLGSANLTGTISLDPFISLDKLAVLNLSSNSFIINSTSLLQLPPGLKQLELAFTGLVGLIPDKLFSTSPNLVYVNLSHNNLTGSISSLAMENSCNSLVQLDLSNNKIMGSMPYNLSNCPNLRILNLSFNELTGMIPHSLCEINKLQKLDLSHNNIAGSIPDSFSLCSSLQVLDISNNKISGTFPSSILENLTSLESLQLSKNAISGLFPASVSACKRLLVVDFSSNNLSGVIPPDICPGAASLQELRIANNYITGEIPSQLSECLQLKTIDVSVNNLNGSIPAELGRLQNLENLIAWLNGLEGKIPPELAKCGNLKVLVLNNNVLSGPIPMELSSCRNLEWISLTSNKLSGEIPAEFGLLTRLVILQLAYNSLNGTIPEVLSNCSSLVWLDLSSNRLAGEIPPRLGRQLGAERLNATLSGNTLLRVRNVGNSCIGVKGVLEFAGIRPGRFLQYTTLRTCDFAGLYSASVLSLFEQYETLEYLDLSYNELHGKIPETFGEMVALQFLELSHNQLSGEIPSSLGQLKNLLEFTASHNRLQGQIPGSFTKLSFLTRMDVSNNELTGQIPGGGQIGTFSEGQFANNTGLCGPPLSKSCNSDHHGAPGTNPDIDGGKGDRRNSVSGIIRNPCFWLGVLVASATIVIGSTVFIHAWFERAEKATMLSRLHSIDAATTWEFGNEHSPLNVKVSPFQKRMENLAFSTLILATNGFSKAKLIGCGAFGEVFKATLRDGTNLAIKKLTRLSFQGDQEFLANLQTLGKIEHRNIVPLLGYCKVGEERLIVYEFMKFGSLEQMLHRRTSKQRQRVLVWEERKRISRSAARGLCFLHHECIPGIIHGNLKTSNILLNCEMEARVSDVGVAKLVRRSDSHNSSTFTVPPAFLPPEYNENLEPKAEWDVYSFGVILLELLTGKWPTNENDFGELNLVGWVKMKVREGKQIEVIEPELLLVAQGSDEGEAEVEEMLKCLEIALKCLQNLPLHRPSMLQVLNMLKNLMP